MSIKYNIITEISLIRENIDHLKIILERLLTYF